MKEGIVLYANGHEQWWWGNETSVPIFEYAFLEIRALFKQAVDDDLPIFFHSHPPSFPRMSETDRVTCRNLLFALRRAFLFIIITPKTTCSYLCCRNGFIRESELFPCGNNGMRILTQLREGSYGSE